MRRRTSVAVGLAVAASVAAGCSGDEPPVVITAAPSATEVTEVPTTAGETTGAVASTPSPVPDATLPPFEPAAIEWEQFNEAIDVGTLSVPVDYANPNGDQFELFLARYNALDQENKIGTLLVNPGGPGFGGVDLVLGAVETFDRPLRDRFDIIGWDPRGTGESEPPIDCIDDYDRYFTAVDSTPADAAAAAAVVALSEEFTQQCVERNGAILDHVGTNSSARDLDTIRRALGEDEVSYFGFSYGSELGAVWATLFPETVRAAVFDGAADPNADSQTSTVQQLRGFQSSLTAFLDDCSANDNCEFHNDGNASAAFDALMESLDANPIVGDPDRPLVNRDVATGAVIRAMYADLLWPSLATSLAAAQQGDGSGLLALFDSYYQRRPDGTWGNELEAFQVISCADDDQRLSVAESDALTAAAHEAAPQLVPEGSIGGYACTFFAPAIDPRVAITGIGAGPIVVIGTTGDPSTPLDSSRAMAEALEDGRLVIVEAANHTGYGTNSCVIDVVNKYLIDLEPPEDGTECR